LQLRKALFGVVTGLCVASTQATATDATWYCSSIEKEPEVFKVEIKGGELFALTSAQKTERYFDRMDGAKQKFNLTAHKIVQDTDKSLIAVFAYPYNARDGTVIDVVLIDKTSGTFRQTAIYNSEKPKKESEISESNKWGIYQMGK
jgi:hypothetical protein